MADEQKNLSILITTKAELAGAQQLAEPVTPPDARGAVWTDSIVGNLLFLPDKLAGDNMNVLIQEICV